MGITFCRETPWYEEIYDFIKTKCKDLYWWILYRTTEKYHIIKLRGLKPGFHENDTRILYAIFTILEDYYDLECEKICERYGKDFEKANEAWIEEVKKNNPPENPQLDAWIEVMELINWWREIRPNRKEPESNDGPDFKFVQSEDNPELSTLKIVFANGEEQEKRWEKYCEESSKLEHDRYKEDKVMMKRVIEICEHLYW